MFEKEIWGAENICVHCNKTIKIWQNYIRPSTYVIHEKCFDAYMKERDMGIPRRKNMTERITEKVMGETDE